MKSYSARRCPLNLSADFTLCNRPADFIVELQALLCRLHSCGSDIERVELTMDDQGYRYTLYYMFYARNHCDNYLNCSPQYPLTPLHTTGLGPIRQHISSVGSLLLFNSSTDPHKSYSTMDNLLSSGRYINIQHTSISHGTAINRD